MTHEVVPRAEVPALLAQILITVMGETYHASQLEVFQAFTNIRCGCTFSFVANPTTEVTEVGWMGLPPSFSALDSELNLGSPNLARLKVHVLRGNCGGEGVWLLL